MEIKPEIVLAFLPQSDRNADEVETTLKLTLLHYGALKMPRLPMPVYGAHKMAKLRLRGIYPNSMLEGDRQFWL
ncbi:hypothetical protein H6G96_26335 [Nostoc sp. FACHB-892]|uniref:hypothetical protein n=1 Tax=Nostoc sp. FACHB-892 TaxID=2692843 RepID=UPI0016894882|nr:hypothetical protein [Nostoc sp. FACHB-892]MBD2729739.1 hypothetical protein [Nostoc sp. FACHB-892]